MLFFSISSMRCVPPCAATGCSEAFIAHHIVQSHCFVKYYFHCPLTKRCIPLIFSKPLLALCFRSFATRPSKRTEKKMH
jgi:hypothetical protein